MCVSRCLLGFVVVFGCLSLIFWLFVCCLLAVSCRSLSVICFVVACCLLCDVGYVLLFVVC